MRGLLLLIAAFWLTGCASVKAAERHAKMTRPKLVEYELVIDGKVIESSRKTYLYEDELETDP